MRSDRPNIVVEKSITLSLRVIDFCKKLQKVDRRIADQLFRSVTSIGANIHEAQNAESRADFIHKLKISAKELDESLYWMRLCKESEHLIFDKELQEALNEMVRILSKIIATSKKNK
jgi:four helix bundle protein